MVTYAKLNVPSLMPCVVPDKYVRMCMLSGHTFARLVNSLNLEFAQLGESPNMVEFFPCDGSDDWHALLHVSEQGDILLTCTHNYPARRTTGNPMPYQRMTTYIKGE